MSNIYIYQIYYDDSSRAALDPGFIPLDNSSNERPDWREYHPIRKFLLGRELEHDAYYGFLSPRFSSKTNLSADQVKSFTKAHEGADVVLFCPFFDQSAFFLNVFEQGEVHHPGLTQVSQDFVRAAGIDVDLTTMINDSTNTIFANYFIARPRFWKAWLTLGEQLFDRAEAVSNANSELTSPTAHRGAQIVPLKVFLMERLATLLLAVDDTFKTCAYDPTALPMSGTAMSRFGNQLLVCDALKMESRRLGSQKHVDDFLALKKHIVASMP